MEDKKTRQNNWLRLVWGLWYVREGLKTFVEVKSKDQHHHFASKVQQQCTNGQPVNCNQCIVNQNLLPASQAQPSSSKVRKTGNQRKRLCPLHGACSELYDLITDNHSITNPRIHWKNTDSTKWWDQAVGHWEVTKCYFSSAGYDDKMGPAEVDASGLLSLCIFSKYMQRHIAQIQNFEKVRDIRNTTLHAANYEVDTQTANDCLDAMIAVLSDTTELHMDKDAKMACVTIQKLKSGSLQMPTDVLKYVNAFAEMKTNADDTIWDLQKKISDYVNQAKDQIYVVMGAAVQTLQSTTIEGVELIKKSQYEAVNSVSDARIAAVNDVTAIKTEAIGKIVISAMTQESERKRIEEEYLQKEKELREDLANFYEDNHETLPLHPILEHKDSKLLDFYQMPSMNIKHHPDDNATRTEDSSDKGSERDRTANGKLCSFEDMFTQPQGKKGKCEVRNVYISADAGMGKSSFCKYIVVVWSALYFCKEKLEKVKDNLHYRSTFKDVDYLKRFSFVFLLTLRDCQCVEYKFENMILKQILENLNRSFRYDQNFLLQLMSRNKCLIILDGLNEWYFPNKPFPEGGNRPSCTFLYTSRPWKLTYSNLSQSLQRNIIEMVGIPESLVKILVTDVTNCFIKNGVRTHNVEQFLDSLYSGEIKAFFASASSNINDILAIPIVVLQLLCLWHEGDSFGKSITETYCKIVDMLFKRSMRKQINLRQSFDLPLKDPVSLPIFFKNASANSCIQNEQYMLQLSELACVTLLRTNKQNTLCFDNSVKCNLFSNEDNINSP